MGEVVGQAKLTDKLNKLRAAGKRIVATNGCFDIIHVGHIRFLKAARALGDILVVGLNSDASVTGLKGPGRPVVGEQDRAEVLAALNPVDYVYLFSEDTAIEFLKIARPHIYAKGGDYTVDLLKETPTVESFGGKVEIIDLIPGRSTSDIVARMKSG